ncbi:MAG: diadenylate cyclase CdaA [Firmicutes bacterium]|nr:diadenylate cyclase CdaA [Bacillota bacterium]
MQAFFNSLLDSIMGIRILDIVDIAIVAFAVYKIINYISKTRAQQLVKGIGILLGALLVSDVLNLYTVHFILSNAMTYGILAIVVIFHPELRRALEMLGRQKFFNIKTLTSTEKDSIKDMISQLCRSLEYFSANKIGALIVLERDTALGEIIENGTKVDAELSAMLLETIFYEGSALHDGAVVVRDERIYAAGCVLPLSRNDALDRTLGTRHRAGIGITETSDAITLIVSEESGIISMAEEGKLYRYLDVRTVEKNLYNFLMSEGEDGDSSNPLMNIFRRKNND